MRHNRAVGNGELKHALHPCPLHLFEHQPYDQPLPNLAISRPRRLTSLMARTTSAKSYPRYLASRLREALTDTPVVLIHGPHQSGKTTLARAAGERRGYRYFSFDNEAARAAAQQDPEGFVAGLPEPAILDEVQRVPEIFTTLKPPTRSGPVHPDRLGQCAPGTEARGFPGRPDGHFAAASARAVRTGWQAAAPSR